MITALSDKQQHPLLSRQSNSLPDSATNNNMEKDRKHTTMDCCAKRTSVGRSKTRKESLKRKRNWSPHQLKRQRSVPITSTDREAVTLAATLMVTPVSLLPSSTDTIDMIDGLNTNQENNVPENNRCFSEAQEQFKDTFINLERALQAVGAVVTVPAVNRIPPCTTTHEFGSSVDIRLPEPMSLDVDQLNVDETVESKEERPDYMSEDYLEQLRMYGMLLRLMGDQLDADYSGDDQAAMQARDEAMTRRKSV